MEEPHHNDLVAIEKQIRQGYTELEKKQTEKLLYLMTCEKEIKEITQKIQELDKTKKQILSKFVVYQSAFFTFERVPLNDSSENEDMPQWQKNLLHAVITPLNAAASNDSS